MKLKLSFIIVILLIFSTISKSVTAQAPETLPEYQIQPGDSLGSIAARFGVSLANLIETNQIIDADLISPGQLLKIPGLTGISGTITPTIIALGDNPSKLAIKYRIDQDQLVSLNKLTSIYEVFAGSNLLIPINSEKRPLHGAFLCGSGTTFLEFSASSEVNPYELVLLNLKSSSSHFIPGESIYQLPFDEGNSTLEFGDPIVELTISPLPLQQGATAEIQVLSNGPISIQGSLNNSHLQFFTEDDQNYYALQGIHAMATQGLSSFEITGTSASGTIFVFQQDILLQPGTFDSDPMLKVDPSTIDPAVTKPEEAMIRDLVSQVTPLRYWSGLFESPAFYQEYNSLFGSRRSYNDNPEVFFHTGVDFAGGVSLPIIAPAAGKVVFAGPLTVRGNTVFIDHGWGIFSGFFHQSKLDVKVGDVVTLGQKIGEVGNSGRVNGKDDFPGAGAHLHWELWVNGIQVNPLHWLNEEYP
jgi:murein DD-endopeptidase MepM/ murein hydrolase activator NlpD